MSDDLTISDVAARTGLSEATLRMWETRHGFPEPTRRPSGHRRYSERDVELLQQVAGDRDRGMSIKAAVERARRDVAEPEVSIYAGLRRRRPDLVPYLLRKDTLIALSHAIEDECVARAERAVLFASFQRERFYRDAQERWRELARTAAEAVVFADFAEVSRPAPDAPLELPLRSDDPLGREWSLVCDAPDYAACLAAWERPGQESTPDPRREFETIWTVEPEIVREAARIALGLAERADADIASEVSDLLGATPPPSGDDLRIVTTLTSRMVAYMGAGAASSLPTPHA
ncbi:MAG: MerR family transcriptional regulator [Thermoleophilaceae bacterium]|nr:MerR family transcriptional regulator [Thermoleophilaceae bacterium]